MKASPSVSITGELEDGSYWKKQIELLKSSNLSRKAYCRQNQVNYDRFAYWIKKGSVKPQPLIAVKLKTEEASESSPKLLCTLILNQGRKLLIHDQAALAWILEGA